MRKLKVGDIVEVLDGHEGSIWVSPMRNYIGKKYRITDFRDHEPNNRIVRIDGSCWNFEEKYLRLVDKNTKIKEDKEVKNPEKIEVGDIVEVLDGRKGQIWASGMDQYIGAKFAVDKFVGTSESVVRLKDNRYYFEAKYLRVVQKWYDKQTIKPGDFVEILDGRAESEKDPSWVPLMNGNIGKIGIVVEITRKPAIIHVKTADGEEWGYAPNWIKKIDPKEYFSEGDKVVILDGRNDNTRYGTFDLTNDHWVPGMDSSIGKIGTIATLTSGTCRVEVPDDCGWWYMYTWVRKATEEEIAAAEGIKEELEEDDTEDEGEDENKADTRSFIDIVKEELSTKPDKAPAPSTDEEKSPIDDPVLKIVDIIACSALNTDHIVDALEKAILVLKQESKASDEFRKTMHAIYAIGKAYTVALEDANKLVHSVISDKILESISED